MSTLHSRFRVFSALCVAVCLCISVALRVGASDPDAVSDALESARTHLLDRDYGAAAGLLEALVRDHPSHGAAAEAHVLLGRARLLGKRPSEAAAGLAEAVTKIDPASPWRAKARFLLADAVAATGNLTRSAALYRAEAEAVLGDAAKAELSARFRALGDEWFAPKKDGADALAPVRPPDFTKARLFYSEARTILSAETLHGDLTLKVGECNLALGDSGAAVVEAERLLATYEPAGPRHDDRIVAQARFLLGRGQLTAGRGEAAREAFHELATSARAVEPAFLTLDILIGRTFGLPRPSGVPNLRAGLEYWRRFLAAHADHESAESVRRETVDAMVHVGEIDDAMKAIREYLARHRDKPAAPALLDRLARLHADRNDQDASREVLREFLDTYPDNPLIPDVQRRLPQLLVTKIGRLDAEGKKKDALTTCRDFLSQYPDHGLAAPMAVEAGRLHLALGEIEGARRAWSSAQERYRQAAPGEASTAAFLLGTLLEDKDFKLPDAVQQYRRVIETFAGQPAAGSAQERLARMERLELEVSSPRVFASDEAAHVKLATGNVKDLTVKIHPIDLATYFRTKHKVDGFESLDVTLIQPAFEWPLVADGYEAYRRVEREVPLAAPAPSQPSTAPTSASRPTTLAPGTYLVTVSDGQRRSMVPVVVSDVRLIVKHSPKQVFVFALDAKEKAPAGDVAIAVSDGTKIVAEGKTGADGVFVKEFDEARSDRRVFGQRGDHVAPGCLPAAPAAEAFGYVTKAHLRTDRPLYRPGDDVFYRAVVRMADRGAYVLPGPGKKVRVSFRNARGVEVWRDEAALTEHGSTSGAFRISPDAPTGDWSGTIDVDGASFSATFAVKVFRKPDVTVVVSTSPDDGFGVRPGDAVKAAIQVFDLFGAPVRDARVTWQASAEPLVVDLTPLMGDSGFDLPPGPTPESIGEVVHEGSGVTDAQGRLQVSFDTKPATADLRHVVVARVEAGDYAAAFGVGSIAVTRESFTGVVKPDRQIYRRGDRATVEVVTVGPGLRAVSRTGDLVVSVIEPGATKPREVSRTAVSTGMNGRATAVINLADPGAIELRFIAKGKHGEDVGLTARTTVQREGFDKLKEVRVLAEREVYKEGQSATVFLDLPIVGVPWLLTFEADRVLEWQVRRAESPNETFSVPLTAAHAPNVTLAAALIDGTVLRTAADEIVVRRHLDVAVSVDKPAYRPGDKATVTVETRDQAGRPVAAEVGIRIVDRAVLSMAGERNPTLRAVFYDRRRGHSVTTGSTCAYVYGGQTVGIDRDILAEVAHDRQQGEEREVRKLLEDQSYFRSDDKKSADEAAKYDSELGALRQRLEPGQEKDRRDSGELRRNRAQGQNPGGGGGFVPKMKSASADRAPAEEANADDFAVGLELADAKVQALFVTDDPLGNVSFSLRAGLTLESLSKSAFGRQLFLDPALQATLLGDGRLDAAMNDTVTRTRFADLALWSAHVMTDAAGKATLEVELPDNLTTWSVLVDGASDSTLVGDGKAEAIVKKALAVRLDRPRYLGHEDRATVRATVENRGDADLDAEVRIESKTPTTVTTDTEPTRTKVGAHGATAIDAEVQGRAPGRATLTVSATSADLRDAAEEEWSVIPFGRRMQAGGAGEMDGETVFDFDTPADFATPAAVVPGSGRCVLVVTRHVLADIVEGLARLDLVRHDSCDQVVTRFKPAAAVLAALDRSGIEAPGDRLRWLRRVQDGLTRLVDLQADDGAFSWWKGGQADAFVHAMALEALGLAGPFGVETVAPALEKAEARALQFLNDRGTSLDAQAALLAALARRGKAPGDHVSRLVRAARDLSPSGLAWMVLATTRSDRAVQAEEVLRRLEGQFVTTAGKVSLRGHASEAWLRDDVEATALGLQALLEAKRSGPSVDGLAAWLRAAIRRSRGTSTKALASAIEALALWSEHAGRLETGGRIDVKLNGKDLGALDFADPRFFGRAAKEVSFADLVAGKNRLVLTGRDVTRAAFSIAADWMSPATDAPPPVGEVRIERRYSRYIPLAEREKDVADGHEILKPEARPKAEPPASTTDLISGERYTVTLRLETDDERAFMALEDPLPAGVEAAQPRAVGPITHAERRDAHVVFFFEKLPKGVTTVHYDVWGAWPGRYAAAGVVATGLYEPRLGGASREVRVTVRPRTEGSARTDVPKPTPDGEWARGSKAAEEGRFQDALDRLVPLLELDLRDDVRDAMQRHVLLSRLRLGQGKEAVRDWETIASGRPLRDLLPQPDVARLGRAFESVGDGEKARELFADVVAGGFEAAARYGAVLAELGRTADALEYLMDLGRSFPDSQAVTSAWMAAADGWFAIPDPTRAKNTSLPENMRMQFERGLVESRRALSHVVSGPIARRAAYRLLEHERDLDLREALIRDATRFIEHWPENAEAEDAQVLLLRTRFAKGEWAAAKADAERLLAAQWTTFEGGIKSKRVSRHATEATYYLGRIAHVGGQMAEAVRHYESVKDAFADARQSWLFFTEKKLVLPVLTDVRIGEPAKLRVAAKNLDRCDMALYGVDLPLVFAIKKGIGRIHQLDLTGIAPDRKWSQPLDAKPHAETSTDVAVDDLKEGAWLLVAKSGEFVRTSLIVVSGLKLTLQRDGDAVRVWVSMAAGGLPVAGAEVRVGDGNRIVATAKTDERGIAILKGLGPGMTVLATSGRAYALGSE